jgi:nucleotide-binding universal stress UspA family protein
MTRQHAQAVRRIVVGVDGSEQSLSALRWAAVLAAATGADIDAVTAWEYPRSYGEPVYTDDWRPDLDAEQVLEDALLEAFGEQRPTSLKTKVLEDPARVLLLEESAGADMVVVGSRGHGGFTGLLLGSVSAACTEQARCAVLVVHADPGARP